MSSTSATKYPGKMLNFSQAVFRYFNPSGRESVLVFVSEGGGGFELLAADDR